MYCNILLFLDHRWGCCKCTIPYILKYISDGGNGMIPGTLTPPDKINGDTTGQQQHTQQQHHWPSPLAITTMAGPMQTPPSSPPMAIERFG